MTDIFKYLDYRHFLKDFYLEKKRAKGQAFSFRSFSRLAGLASPNFLKLVMEGQRNLGEEGIRRFAKGLGLGREEAHFFECLVRFNQAASDEERNRWYAKIAASHRYRAIREIDRDQYVYYSRWYFAAVRELVLLPDFKASPEWVAKKLSPRIKPKEAKEALDLLERLGFLKRDRDGRLIQAEQNLTTAREVQSLAISNYHREMLQKASESIERTPPTKRDISSITIALSQEKFKEAKRRIQEFRRELNVLLSDDKMVDAVYQLNFQIFNLTEVPWSGA